MKFSLEPAPLQGVVVITRRPIGDNRGLLERLFCENELRDLLGERHIVQINRTLTEKSGTVRGLHFQHPPFAETKVVQCLRGEVYDVAVDLRSDSPTFLKWFGVRLSETNHRTLVIPEGFAHGLQTLTPFCEMLYLHTARYSKDAEDGILADDEQLGIGWPLPITERSTRDLALRSIGSGFEGVRL